MFCYTFLVKTSGKIKLYLKSPIGCWLASYLAFLVKLGGFAVVATYQSEGSHALNHIVYFTRSGTIIQKNSIMWIRFFLRKPETSDLNLKVRSVISHKCISPVTTAKIADRCGHIACMLCCTCNNIKHWCTTAGVLKPPENSENSVTFLGGVKSLVKVTQVSISTPMTPRRVQRMYEFIFLNLFWSCSLFLSLLLWRCALRDQNLRRFNLMNWYPVVPVSFGL